MSAIQPIEGDDSEQSGIWLSQVYKSLIEPLHVLNFCIYNDQTQNVLWRIQNGELGGFRPKVIILNIGTHNKNHNAEEIVEGIMEIIKVLQEKMPNSHILLLGLLPCGRNPNPKRTKHEKVNLLLSQTTKSINNLTFINPDPEKFLQPDGTISHQDMLDYLHPTEAGYSKLADLLSDDLQSCLQTFLKTNAPFTNSN